MEVVPEPYRRWQGHAGVLLKSLDPLMPEDAAEFDLRGPPSDHDLQADRLEAFARPCLLTAFWLHSLSWVETPADRILADRRAAWLRRALVRGTTPGSRHQWGPNANYHQNGVEMGLLVIALEIARNWLWEPLSESEKAQVAHWMASNRGTGHHWNNHFFFGIFALEFLESVGFARKADRWSISHWFDEMELMYRGQGWFMDGMNQTYDHYNAYAFHFYAPMWAYLYRTREPGRIECWLDWTREFLESYQHSFAPSGEHPAFGRSMTYRFNATAPFAAAQLVGANPLSPGRSRRLCTRNLEFFLSRPIYQDQGAIGIGWTDIFPEVAEAYSCAGSVYWCAKAFAALLIAPDDPFWTDPEAPLVSEEEAFEHTVVPAGLVFRKVEDAVEILNAGSEICATNRDKFGPYKWGKIAYRTGFAFTLGDRSGYSIDLGLTALDPRDGRRFGRHYTVPLDVSDSYYISSYNLGDRDLQCNVAVETMVAWKGPWLLQIHRCMTYQPTELSIGGYALPCDQDEEVLEDVGDDLACARVGRRMVALQCVGAGGDLSMIGRRDESEPRRHLMTPFHRIPVMNVPVGANEEFWTAALCLATESADASEVCRWKIERRACGEWTFWHKEWGTWTISHPWLPDFE